ncbi:transposase [Aspergillus affinis]|uniref:transposase n=1 Tax=Aspergillus affinis TaxID=1070780 RepID=UPI0022FE59BE|nr:uncharacterized protein KD926_003704 [Aspergillus affinis]KAI9035360.1 hypothetical protein KD926_003704 [Aspergillus affinis]
MGLPKDDSWLFNHAVDADNHLIGLFCIHRSCLKLLRDHSYVLIMDCTYKTNNYKMPMLDINGVTSIGTTYFVGFVFMYNEKEPSYNFALTNLKAVYEHLKLSLPRTILTDKERALINACQKVFPSADHMICLWHVMNNIHTKARPLLHKELIQSLPTAPDPKDKDTNEQLNKDTEDRLKKMLPKFMTVIQAPTHSDAMTCWQAFKDKYDNEIFQPLLAYIEKEWLNEDTKPQILECFTNNFFHLDMRSTSRGEASHWRLKKDLGTSIADYLYVIQSFERSICHQHNLCQIQIDHENIEKPLRMLRSSLFGNVLTRISQFALYKVLSIYDKFLLRGDKKLPIPEACTGNTQATQGIPCIHIIEDHMKHQKSLSVSHFHPQWYLYPAADTSPGSSYNCTGTLDSSVRSRTASRLTK